MTLPGKHDPHNLHNHRRLYRMVKQVRGTLDLRMECPLAKLAPQTDKFLSLHA